jgi:hypothetical protein
LPYATSRTRLDLWGAARPASPRARTLPVITQFTPGHVARRSHGHAGAVLAPRATSRLPAQHSRRELLARVHPVALARRPSRVSSSITPKSCASTSRRSPRHDHSCRAATKPASRASRSATRRAGAASTAPRILQSGPSQSDRSCLIGSSTKLERPRATSSLYEPPRCVHATKRSSALLWAGDSRPLRDFSSMPIGAVLEAR